VFELELVNVANVKISSSNVANFQLGIGIGFGNIFTLATFTSMELELVNVANVKISSSNVAVTAPCGLSGISRYQEKAIEFDSA